MGGGMLGMCVYLHNWGCRKEEFKGSVDGVFSLVCLWVPWAGLSGRGQLTLRRGLGIRSSSISEGNRERRK